MPLTRSQILISRAPDILRRVPARLFAAKAGIDVETAAAVKRDPRIVPPVRLIAGLCHAYGLLPADVVGIDPMADPAAVAPQWFGGGRRLRAVVCGMGNQGHAWAAWLAAQTDTTVIGLVSTPARAANLAPGGRTEILMRRVGASPLGGTVAMTADPVEALAAADLVIITDPADRHLAQLRRLIPHLRPGAVLVCVPGWAGFDWKARRELDRAGRADVAVALLTSVPWMAKATRPGAEVAVPGAKSLNSLVPVRGLAPGTAADLMSLLLGVPVVPMPSSLDIHLMPGNQILHTGIMHSLFADWDGRPLAESPLFYEGLSVGAADLVAAMNADLITIANALHKAAAEYEPSPLLDLHAGLRSTYGADIADTSSLRSCIAGNAAYAGVRAPMTAVPGGLAPDFTHRFFTEDVPHGLALAIGCGRLAGTATPALDRVMAWCQDRMGKAYLAADGTLGADWRETSAPQNFGLATAADLVTACRAAY